MKQEMGFVSDDFPRAGWFHTHIAWFKKPIKNSSGTIETYRYLPKMSIHDNKNEIVNWTDIPFTLEDNDWTGLRDLHPKRLSYGINMRYLLKIPVTVTNIRTPEDANRIRNRTYQFAQKTATTTNSQSSGTSNKSDTVSKEQVEMMGRLEAGSYLKVWARNEAYPWEDKARPCDDETESCMYTMRSQDKPLHHPNYLFNKPALPPQIDVSMLSDKYDINEYIKRYFSVGTGVLEVLKAEVNASCPADRVADIARANAQKTYSGFPTPSSGTYEPLANENQETLLKPADRTLPDIFPEDSNKEKSSRYQCGGDFFRPFSFRNYTWKRNRFSMDGAYHEDKWYHVVLWPQEMLNLTGRFFGDPTRASFPFTLSVTAIYVGVMVLLAAISKSGKKKADTNEAAFKAKNPGKPSPRKPISADEFLKELMSHEDWPLLFAALAYKGLPDYKEREHVATLKEIKETPDPSKSMVNILNEFKPKLDDKDFNSEKAIFGAFALIQKLIIAYIDVTDGDSIASKKQWLETMASFKAGATGNDQYWFQKKKLWQLSGSLKDAKIGLAPFAIGRTMGKAWPLPPPASFLAMACALKGSLGLEGEIDGSEMAYNGKAELGLSLGLKGLMSVQYDLGLFYTLAKELGSAFTGEEFAGIKTVPDSKNGLLKVEKIYKAKTSEWPFMDILTEVMDYLGAKIGISAKVNLLGVLKGKLDFEKLAENIREGFSFAEGREAQSCKIDFELPVVAKVSKLEWTLCTMKIPLLTADNVAIVMYPNGIKIEGDFFKGVKFQPMQPVVIKTFSFGTFKDNHTLSSRIQAGVGQVIESTVTAVKMIDTKTRPNDTVDLKIFFKYSAKSANGTEQDESIQLETDARLVNFIDSENANIKFSSTLSYSHTKLVTDSTFYSFVSQLLKKNVSGTLVCRWPADEKQDKPLANGVALTFLTPIVSDAFFVTSKMIQPYDTVTVQFKVENLGVGDNYLYVKYFEKNNNDLKDISFVNGKAMHGRAVLKNNGFFETVLSVSDLNTFGLIDESDDDCWEIVFKVALDMNHRYVLPFNAGAGFPGHQANSILKVKKLMPVF